ncbi:MAG: tetratricopeptide repeat protein [Deltaproteobacteria bacterium]|nr:tetratricopeptide repeat protein [Deltaproteobacteria bacterium]
MYAKVLLAIIIAILAGFFYLHTENPGVITFVVTKDHTYALPAALLLFIGFLAGAGLAVINSLLVDAKRAIKEVMSRREKRQNAEADENYRKGVEALAIGDTRLARTHIEKALMSRPTDAGMIISLSDTYMREGRAPAAMKVLENGITNNPGDSAILSAIGKCSRDAGDDLRASKAFDEVIETDPKNQYALRNLRDIMVKEKAWPQAASMQKRVLDNEDDNRVKERERRLYTGLLFETAAKLAEEGRLVEAISKVKEVLKNDSAFMPAHMLLGMILYRQGNAANAIKVWEKEYSRRPALPLLLKIEDAHIKESAPDRILERYNREISANPGEINPRLLLARLYLRLEMVDNAIDELEGLYHEGEDTFYVQALLGEAYLRRKQTAKAAILFQKALDIDRELMPPFACRACSHKVRSWRPRCPGCGEWNSLEMAASSASSRTAPPGRVAL